MNIKRTNTIERDILILLGIWLVSAISDRLWIALDTDPPSWDLAKHLNSSLSYWSFLQKSPQLLSGEWWQSFWTISEKYPPLVYFLTAPFLSLFGRSSDAALLVNLLFSAILIASVYGIGKTLFNSQVGLWSAAICFLLPRLYAVRLQYLADYPLTALVTASFCCLTIWKRAVEEKQRKGFNLLKSWLWAIAFGICFGLSMLIKQTTLFFLFIPIVWLLLKYLFGKHWLRLFQLIIGIFVGIIICGGWYRTNWIFVLSAFGNANVTPAKLEGDPPLNTLAAWTYYWNDLPSAISWILLLVPIVGLLLAIPKLSGKLSFNNNVLWLAGYFVAAYLINSAFVNKDHRYIMPYLPVVAVLLGYSLNQWRYPWRERIGWIAIALSTILMWLNLFPLGATWLTQNLTPNSQYHAYTGKPWYHQELIQEIIDTEPYLTNNLGVLPSTPEINQHNFNYYGKLQGSQVHGRQVGVRVKQVVQDARSLSWFVTKTGDRQGLSEAQLAILKIIENGGDFRLHKSWDLPDNTQLKLYRDRQPFVEVQPLNERLTRVKLEKVIVPSQVPPGKPISVTYEWSGGWEQLQSGLLLLTWKTDNIASKDRWFHDRAIGLGNLYSLKEVKAEDGFRVTEHIAMYPPSDIEAGNYILEATYLNKITGETYPIDTGNTKLEIAPQATAIAAPELDLVTQMRWLALELPEGREALDPIFAEVGRINQYDPMQDYLVQAEKTLSYRLQQEPNNLEFMYALALSQALQQKINPLLETLKQITLLDANNPNAHAYLAFVYLYDWRAKDAEKALQPAININPNLVEVKALKGIAAIMQGNLVKGWQIYQQIKHLL